MSADGAPRLAAVELGLVSVPRFRQVLERRGERLLARVFSPDEIAYAARKRDGAHNLAARFAAKCAGRRALQRLGLPRPRWRELEVVRRRSGEPTLRVAGTPGLHFTLSLTHDPALAAASVWVTREVGA